MDSSHALEAFAALSTPTRLEVFRLLIKAGPRGMLAGEIAEALEVRQNTMSANLAVLTQAGLIRNLRQGRAIRYFADTEGIRGLLAFLLEDCCGGAAVDCDPLIKALTCC